MVKMICLPEGASFIINTLRDKSYEAYAVGGCVRDSLLGKVPVDWDITTSAEPSEVLRLFRKSGCGVVPTGIKHGTVTVIYKTTVRDKVPYEVTTYRVDGDYSDGRRPDSVRFTKSLRDDLKRRDFTINAMAYDGERVVDFFDGRKDLEEGVIRCVGNAGDRFSEDYLRMLRAYRFAAVLGFGIDDEAIKSVRENRDKVLRVAAERIRIELDKTICNGSMEGIYAFLDMFLEVLIPEAAAFIEDIKGTIANTDCDLAVRLAVILYGVRDAETVLRRLKYDRKTIDSVCMLLRFKESAVCTQKPRIKEILTQTGVELFIKLNGLQRAVYSYKGAGTEWYERRLAVLDEIVRLGEPYRIKDLAVTGNDIMSRLGERAGAHIGNRLNLLLGYVINDPGLNEKQALLELLSKITDRGE